MKILLMGGSGIISSEICTLAIKRGYEVSIINRGLRKNKINDNAKLIVADLKRDLAEDICQKLETYDIIIDFISYDRNQLKRSIKIANGRCKQFIFVSSATAYLDLINNRPFDEECEVGNTGWAYAAEKAACEEMLRKGCATGMYSFDYTIIRPYVTYNETRIPYQVCPLLYYTLINRIKLGKPIPIFGDEVRCTLTTASDFAVGVVGLFMNQKAINEIFHITGDCIVTWEEVARIIGCKLGKEVFLVHFPISVLDKGSRKLGFDSDEIRYDKGRDMIFDNSKIKSVVPEFLGTTVFADAIDNSIQYFEIHKEAAVVDYSWDARIDRLIEANSPNVNKKSISINAYGDTARKEELRIYRKNRNDFLYYTSKIVKKIFVKLRRI